MQVLLATATAVAAKSELKSIVASQKSRSKQIVYLNNI